ncbi:glucan biosynthesis protein G [Bradyrhizobium symbiodeficiens]|uniref:glucan biosynthesis protein G n=1 Tax=Bradyrhizobium symbiodeficiens TaxID=1404367 RepID=UPI00140F9B2F|nr:glucan biosynthesis protein G [Bradyrhizobium symbiodeficiens]QIO99012.1 glucan biosynthesis protein G [Bradyrhizobium symbiodeficiens]
MNRRDLLRASAAVSAAAILPRAADAQAGDAPPFSPSTVREQARALAAKPFVAPDGKLPDALTNLNYDQYRSIRFAPEKALWRDGKLPFQVQFFHRGFFYKNRVDIFEVANRSVTPVSYRRADFSFGEGLGQWPDADLGFAGFRIHTPINKPDYYDELCVFLGASYFRAVAKGQTYGLSARGLAIDTGESKGEEFPVFKAFWLEKPAPNSSSMVVHALLDSKSAAASYRFTIRPGQTTVFDVEMALYPRVDVEHAGLAPMTSMFFFGPNDRKDFDDFRPSVHDSDGLSIFNGRGEQLWRPLNNPHDLQVSSFADVNPGGFGLMQRERNYLAYQDLESSFETRPSLWFEPIGDWGEGAVKLIEIPTKEEVHDNIATLWQPKQPLTAKSEHIFTYRLHWGPDAPKADALARFTRTGIGSRGDDSKLFVLELMGDRLKSIDPKAVKGMVTAEKAEISNIVTQPNPATGGWRLSFQCSVKGQPSIELRAFLAQNDAPVSEIWIYRWTP